MLSCRDVTERAGTLIDGELPPGERFGVRLHLLVCSHCRRFLRQLRVLNGAMRLRGRQHADTEPDAALQARLVAVLTQAALPPAIAAADGTPEHPAPTGPATAVPPDTPPDSRP